MTDTSRQVEALAMELEEDVERVRQAYQRERHEVESLARIPDYLAVIIAKRVRARARRRALL